MSTTGHLAAASAVAGAGIGLVIIMGFVLRTTIAVSRRSGGWRDVGEFLGIRTSRKESWYKTWTS